MKHNDLMNEKHKKLCRSLNYLERFIIFISAGSGCVSISAFALLVGVPIGIGRSAETLKICAIIAGIQESISQSGKKKHSNIELLANTELNTIGVFVSKALTNSYVNHDEFVLENNVLREYNEIKGKIKNPKIAVEYTI